MSRSTKARDSGSDRTKVRVFYAEVDGSNQSVQEMMRSLTTAMGRSPQIMGPNRVLRAPNAPAGDARENETAEPELVDGDLLSDTEEEATPVEASPASARRRRGEGPKKDRNAGIDLVPDLDLVQENGTSLTEFFVQKKPTTAEKQVLVFAYYLKHHVKVSPIGPGHILTCYTHLELRKPLDLKQTIRNFAKNKGWLTCADMNDLKLTTAGENHVKHELGKGDASDSNGTK